MNPFDLPGPEFLVFYLALIAVVLGAGWHAIRLREEREPAALPLSDPYQIAWLRGRDKEAARVAVLSLLDRDLVELDGATIVGKPDSGDGVVSHPLERAILERCRKAGTMRLATIAADPAVKAIGETYRAELDRLHLTADDGLRAYRWGLYFIAMVILEIVGVTKWSLALERGHGNVGFLIALMIAAPIAAALPLARTRTRLGDRMLEDLERLFRGLQDRVYDIRRGQATADVMLLAAVFGFAALGGLYGDLQQAYARADASSSSSSGSSCGSSDGGSSCGGGGGCGGCGSGC